MEDDDDDVFSTHYCSSKILALWHCHCTMWLSTQLELLKICKSKGLIFAQFWSKSGNSSCDWWKTLKKLLEKYSNPIFAKNVISIGKKPVAGVWESWNLAHK